MNWKKSELVNIGRTLKKHLEIWLQNLSLFVDIFQKKKYWWCLYSMQDKVYKPPFENTKDFKYIQCTSGPYDVYWKHLKVMAYNTKYTH